MSRTYIYQAAGVPAATSPISHAVVSGDTCHISGQLSLYEDGYRAGSARDEAARAFQLVFLIAEAAGFKREDLVYVDIAFSDLERDLAEVNGLITELFNDYPARTIYEAKCLPFRAKVKVQVIAIRDVT